jgi:hypothetical protein
MKLKTSELQGAVLDWAVAKAEGIELSNGCYNRLLVDGRMSTGQKMLTPYNPSTDWALAGPIIEREWLDVTPWPNESDEDWVGNARTRQHCCVAFGPTPLIAAMRCYVASKFGDDLVLFKVEVPNELA